MNIFYLDEDPEVAAIVQYNKHVVKMILESAQLLCTAHHELQSDIDVPYKATHRNHPSAIWARRSLMHYKWLYEHMLALGAEYKKRYNKDHLTILKCRDVLCYAPGDLINNEFEQPPQCMPDEYKSDDAVDAYWNYYINEKQSCCNTSKELLYTDKPF